MTLLRQLLVKLRSWYYSDERRKVIQTLLLVFVGATLAGFALDIFAPFTGLWNVARSAVLLPIAMTAFMLFYMIALWAKDRRKVTDPDWVPLRERYSPRRRLQVGIVCGAVLLVVVYSLSHMPGYTLIASLVVTAALGLVTFNRRTLKETRQSDLGIPDSRDANYNRVVDQARKRREEKAQTKSNTRDVRRERLLRGRKAAESLEAELEGK